MAQWSQETQYLVVGGWQRFHGMNSSASQIGVEGARFIITVSGTKAVIGLIVTGSIISLKELVCVPMKPTNTLLGLRRLSGL